MSIADANNFVEEHIFADLVETSDLENLLTIDETSRFVEKFELEIYVMNAQLDSLLKKFATSTTLKNFVVAAEVDKKFNY